MSSQWLSGVSPALIARWIGYQLPDTLVKVLPMAAVLMTVVAYGRMSTEHELVAAQSGGVGLGRLARPALLTGAVLTALSAWLSLWVAPRANVEARGLYWDSLTGSGLAPLVGKTVDLGRGLSLSLGGYDAASRTLRDVRVERWAGGAASRQTTVIFADSGQFEGQRLTLSGYSLYTVDYAQARRLALPSGLPSTPDTLRSTLRGLFPRVAVQAPGGPPLRLDTGLSRQDTLAQYADAIGADAQGWPELITSLSAPGIPTPERQAARLTLNRKLALPFANLVLVLAALPFALRFGRTLGVSLGVALLIAVAYYLLFAVGLSLSALTPQLPEPGVWLANLVFALGGLWGLRRT